MLNCHRGATLADAIGAFGLARTGGHRSWWVSSRRHAPSPFASLTSGILSAAALGVEDATFERSWGRQVRGLLRLLRLRVALRLVAAASHPLPFVTRASGGAWLQ